MKFLIVDDNSDTRNLIRTILVRHGHVVLESRDGSEAIATYAAQRPDHVVMDIEMPGMDGIRATREIKIADPGAHITILTTFDDDRLRTAAAQAGAEHYILKENLMDLPTILGK